MNLVLTFAKSCGSSICSGIAKLKTPNSKVLLF